jgi:hypothetical protein
MTVGRFAAQGAGFSKKNAAAIRMKKYLKENFSDWKHLCVRQGICQNWFFSTIRPDIRVIHANRFLSSCINTKFVNVITATYTVPAMASRWKVYGIISIIGFLLPIRSIFNLLK